MSKAIQNQYAPDYVSPPGETLLEKISELGMSQAELAQRTGRTKKLINEIVQGKAPITPETALQFERVLNVPARFWSNREGQYRQHLAQREEAERLANQIDWLTRFPVRAMAKLGWIQTFGDKVQQLRELLDFLGVASPEQWGGIWDQSLLAYRKTSAFQSEPEAISAWLRRGEIEAQSIHCQPYEAHGFREILGTVRGLTSAWPFQAELVDLCARVGVAVVFVPQLPRARVSGITRWLTPDKALIQLSLRYKTDDQLWFTFFHEAGHLLLHGKRDVFLESEDLEGDNRDLTDEQGLKEEEANAFAARILIPPATLGSFLSSKRSKSGHFSKHAVQEFARELGIAPGIVVGRLQHDGHLPRSHLNGLKRRLEWIAESDRAA